MFYLLIITVFVIVLAFHGALLLWVTKLFKIENPTYKKNLIVSGSTDVSGTFLIFILVIFGLYSNLFANLISVILVFLVFHNYLRKYYQTAWKKSLKIYTVFIIFSLILAPLIVFSIRGFIMSPYLVSGDAMNPTYLNGDYLIAQKIYKDISRTDIVVINLKSQPEVSIIERVVGLPGEKVEIKNGKVLINEQNLDETYIIGSTSGETSVVLSENQYFILGDNRDNSFDSRNFGPIDKSRIKGKIFYRVGNFNN